MRKRITNQSIQQNVTEQMELGFGGRRREELPIVIAAAISFRQREDKMGVGVLGFLRLIKGTRSVRILYLILINGLGPICQLKGPSGHINMYGLLDIIIRLCKIFNGKMGTIHIYIDIYNQI